MQSYGEYLEYYNCTDPQLTIQHGEGICIMRGQSDIVNYQTGEHYPRYYNGPAINARNDPNLNELLKEMCPSYVNSPVCCDYQQALFLHHYTSFFDKIFNNCPACYHNFRTLFCGMWCDPNQSLFLKPKLMQCSISYIFIEALDVSVASHLTDTLYNSCKDVKFDFLSCINVIRMMCPEYHPCNNSSQWLQFLGDPSLDYRIPFFIHFNITNNITDSISPLNTTVYNCNDVKSGLACSCMDCPSKPCNNPTIDHHITLLSEDNVDQVPMMLMALSVVVVFVITFGLSVYRFYKPVKLGHSLKKSSNNQDDPEPEHICYWYDYIISNHPTTVILMCLVIAGLLAVGNIHHIREIMRCSTRNDSTTSQPPVQLIVTAPNFTDYNITLGGSNMGLWTFGPVFVREVLLEAFYLQHNITTSSGSVTYNNICYKPDGVNCMIDSIFEYFQNSIDNLLYSEADDFGIQTFNASYHLHYCIRYIFIRLFLTYIICRYPASTHDKYAWSKNMSCATSFDGIVEATNVLAGYANCNTSLPIM